MNKLTPAVREALTRGRQAAQQMANARTDDDYLNAAAALGDAFNQLDRLLTQE
jgi:uncharacterized protein HemY